MDVLNRTQFVIISDNCFFILGAKYMLHRLYGNNTELLTLGKNTDISFLMQNIKKDNTYYIVFCESPSLYQRYFRYAHTLFLPSHFSMERYNKLITNFISSEEACTVEIKDGIATTLSPRELQMLYFFRQGIADEHISQQCRLSINAIGSYRRSIIAKLDLKNKINLYHLCNQLNSINWGVKHDFCIS